MSRIPSKWPELVTLFRSRNFLLLWLGQLFSQGGDRFAQLFLIALAASRAAGSTWGLAKVLAATALPALLLNPIAGVYVDRWDRKRTMITCDLIRVGVILTFPALAALSNPLPLYGAVFLLFAVSAFFIPARLAIIPDLVPADRLNKANALFAVSGMVGSAVIILIGSLILEWLGLFKSAIVNALFFVGSAASLWPVQGGRGHRTPSAAGTPESPRRIFHEVWEGIVALWRHPPTHRAMALLGLLMAGGGATIVVGAVMIQQTWGSVTKDIGFLSLWYGIGIFAGTMAYGRWESDLPRRAALALAFLGAGLSLAGWVGAVRILASPAAASIATAALGFWSAPVGVIVNTMVHEGHPERLHGRVFSSFGVVVNVALVVSMLGAGWLTEAGGRGRLLVGVAGLFLLAAVAIGIGARSPEPPSGEPG
ncbi:MAG: hypothetical protein COV76_00355 [Candidatus Omnitrophica bacterium CG11_big_fil_rev_8_21_14_0_20_64_10]|nr:MAG: hypothetical protein COV76_00355 [Candidatus Omnitrophica bacterium CG11_big_fil_rev_8_21_14_0_20_64_10]